MREELATFLDEMEQQQTRQHSVTEELEEASKFHYAFLQKEVIIGGVYVRIFNGFGGGGRECIREILIVPRLLQLYYDS